jgi:uncharacterized protein with PIN domain
VSTASFRFDDALAPFLRREHRGQRFAYRCARAATMKNAIEALGVPHTEVGAVSVNGAPATLQRTVREGDSVEVHGVAAEEVGPAAVFLADAHLGGLARFLRMLGFDTAHRNAMHDTEIRRLAEEDGRIVLTRDRELLKCREVQRGHYVRALKAQDQLEEVVARYGLAQLARPFTLCLHCNLRLETADGRAVAQRVPEGVRALHTAFSYCRGCDRIYWPGSHYERMRARIAALA